MIDEDGARYDALHGDYAGGAELAFYRDQARAAGGPVLELGCGTGRLAIPLAEDGWAVTGVDAAPAMLATARAKAAARGASAEWVEADVRSLDLGRRFALVTLPINTIAHFPDFEDLEGLFASVKRHLAPGGRFVLALFNPDFAILGRDPNARHPVGEFYDPETQERVVWSERNRYDRASQLNHISWYFERGGWETHQDFAMRIFFPRELEALFRYNGLAVEAVYGDYDGSPFGSDSPQQLWQLSAAPCP